MSQKPTDDDLLAQLEELEQSGAPKARTAPSKKKPTSRVSRPAQKDTNDEKDLLAELENLAKPSSRPATPKLPASTSASRTRSPRRAAAGTPSSGSARTSEDKSHAPAAGRKSTDSTRSYRQSWTPSLEQVEAEQETKKAAASAPPPAQPDKQQGGGWWGGIFATATAAVKQAEAAVKEIQKNEEAQRWAEQVKGNMGALRNYGGELRSKALPTFTNILHTLAPPISQHERLQIHITHDLIGYPSLDPIIYQTFSRVMSQVEGGDLMVIQRGSESTHRRASDVGFTGSGTAGWSDGPWWRQNDVKRDLGAVKGLVEGTKLVRVSAESYANEFFASRGGVEEAAKYATEVLSESNPVRSSDIFLAIQPISYVQPEDLFSGAPEKKEGGVEEPKDTEELIAFAIYLHDPIHSITFRTLTQSTPQKWADWLDAAASHEEMQLPEEIMEIIQSGGVDPREWIAEWMEEVISLGIGVVAQRYVARRMGVGEGGIGRGKAREAAIDSGAAEAARAI